MSYPGGKTSAGRYFYKFKVIGLKELNDLQVLLKFISKVHYTIRGTTNLSPRVSDFSLDVGVGT